MSETTIGQVDMNKPNKLLPSEIAKRLKEEILANPIKLTPDQEKLIEDTHRIMRKYVKPGVSLVDELLAERKLES